MAEIEHIRHTLAHLLAAAVKELYEKDGAQPKLAIGPAIDNGFYYDIDFEGDAKPTEEDLGRIEKKMRQILTSWTHFDKREASVDEAKSWAGANTYKHELIDGIIQKGENISFYKVGNFEDLCRGGHVDNPSKEISPDSFKLDKLAGAYWRGDEKNKMLTRIYGLAFTTKEELDAYLAQREEALKRDHRKIAREQDLLVFSDLVGSGMPMYTPRGNIIRNAIVNYSRELNAKLGFGEVHTPNINKAELFKLSGHYDAYKEDMLSVRSQYVSDEMFMKPMNCPQHTQIYASQARSYRDLPIRYADFANLYRDERPGELSGLTRLRAFAQDDGHIFCREDQIESEVSSVLSAIVEALATYKIDYWMRLSLRGDTNPEKYLGDPVIWEKAQEIMRTLLTKKNIEFREAAGEAAFYGPKIDIMAVDAIGREWQISTIQLDFVQPSRFGLEYTAEDGTKKTPVMIHRALIGSPDRFLGILIEHYAGAMPLWMAPVQIDILPVSDAHLTYAETVTATLKSAGIRAELRSDDSLGKRIRAIKIAKTPYFIVVGDAEVAAENITVEKRSGEKEVTTISDLVAKLGEEIRTKSQ